MTTPTFSSHQFDFLAGILRKELEATPIGERQHVERLIENFAASLRNTNPKFDIVKFIQACGLA